jgi:hypothetical protein
MSDPIRRSSENRASSFHYALLSLLCLTVLAAHVHLAPTAPFLDEGDHVNTGRLLAHGRLMYKDAFNEKGPGLYWLTAGLFLLCGDSFSVVRYAATFGMILTLLLLFALSARYGRPAAGLAAGAIFAAFHLLLMGRIWQSESLLTPLSLAVLYLLASEREDEDLARWKWFVAGLALYLTTCTKQTGWLLVLLVFAALIVNERSARVKRLLGAVGPLALGLLLPWMLTLALVHAQGDGKPFLEGYLFPVWPFQGRAYFEGPKTEEFYLELPIWWMTLTVFLVAIGGRQIRLPRRDRALITAVLAAAVLMLTQRLSPHHFLPVLAVACFGFCMTVFSPPVAGGKAFRRVLLAGFVALTALAASYAPAQYRNRVDKFNTAGWREVSARVAAMTKPNDPIFVFPHDSNYYYLSHREPPGRYGFLLPWTSPPLVVARVMAEFSACSPKVVLYTYLSSCTPSRHHPREYLAPFLKMLVEEYRVDRLFENQVVLLARRDDGADDRQYRSQMERLFSMGQEFCGAPPAYFKQFIMTGPSKKEKGTGPGN